MTYLWTWKGAFFGYCVDNNLFTYRGKCVGRFEGNEIYDRKGKYLGEIINNNRLITNCSKKRQIGSPALALMSVAIVRHVNYVGYVMYVGYEDFPNPDSL